MKMTSDGDQLAENSRQLLRAKRVPDAEWEFQRERLSELYLKYDASHKDVVNIMAREYHFGIT